MTYEDRDLLRMAGRHVATLLAQQAADRRLAESRQFDAFNRFAAFVMHDLKNSVAQLQLLTSNAARHRHNPEFIDDAFVTIENAAARISRLIAQLQSRDTRTTHRVIDVRQTLETAVARCSGNSPQPLLEMPQGNWGVEADPERLAAVFEHVLRNAQEAAGAAGEVRVQLEHADDRVAVTISDTGAGMDPDFIRDRLFRPFDSTKGSSGMGVGAYQARAYVIELGGTVEVRSAPGSGTLFIIRIPKCQKETNRAS
jgi:putative PEP-CTERM system histidine kinase